MTFKQSVKYCLGPGYLFKFQGRAPRSEYWWFALFLFAFNLAISWLASLFGGVGAYVSLGASLFFLPASLGVAVRRLHDRNLSGWWLLAPIVTFLLAPFLGLQANVLASLVILLMCVAYLAVLCAPSQLAANRFGPPPALTPVL